MSHQRDIDLVNELLSQGAEADWLEFKRDNVEPDTIGVRCSALANAARLAGKDMAYMLWGIDNATVSVAGTRFNPDTQKAHGQELAFWLAQQLPLQLFREAGGAMQAVLYGPRTFAQMMPDERIRACYHHAVLRFLSGERMKNASLCERFGIDLKNAAQTSSVIKKAFEKGLVRVADPEHPRAGYVPWWA